MIRSRVLRQLLRPQQTLIPLSASGEVGFALMLVPGGIVPNAGRQCVRLDPGTCFADHAACEWIAALERILPPDFSEKVLLLRC